MHDKLQWPKMVNAQGLSIKITKQISCNGVNVKNNWMSTEKWLMIVLKCPSCTIVDWHQDPVNKMLWLESNHHICSVDPFRGGACHSHNQDHLTDQDQRGCGSRLYLFWHFLPLHHLPFYLWVCLLLVRKAADWYNVLTQQETVISIDGWKCLQGRINTLEDCQYL